MPQKRLEIISNSHCPEVFSLLPAYSVPMSMFILHIHLPNTRPSFPINLIPGTQSRRVMRVREQRPVPLRPGRAGHLNDSLRKLPLRLVVREDLIEVEVFGGEVESVELRGGLVD